MLAGYSLAMIRDTLGAPTRGVICGMIDRHLKDSARQAKKPLGDGTWKAPRRPAVSKRHAIAAKVEPVEPPPAEGAVAYLSQHAGQCRWIYGNPRDTPLADLLVCGEPAKEGRSYCSAHCPQERREAPQQSFRAGGAMSTDTGTNWFEQANAAQLAQRIRKFWAEEGKIVTVWTERMTGTVIADAYVIRSNMVDGKPRA